MSLLSRYLQTMKLRSQRCNPWSALHNEIKAQDDLCAAAVASILKARETCSKHIRLPGRDACPNSSGLEVQILNSGLHYIRKSTVSLGVLREHMNDMDDVSMAELRRIVRIRGYTGAMHVCTASKYIHQTEKRYAPVL